MTQTKLLERYSRRITDEFEPSWKTLNHLFELVSQDIPVYGVLKESYDNPNTDFWKRSISQALKSDVNSLNEFRFILEDNGIVLMEGSDDRAMFSPSENIMYLQLKNPLDALNLLKENPEKLYREFQPLFLHEIIHKQQIEKSNHKSKAPKLSDKPTIEEFENYLNNKHELDSYAVQIAEERKQVGIDFKVYCSNQDYRNIHRKDLPENFKFMLDNLKKEESRKRFLRRVYEFS